MADILTVLFKDNPDNRTKIGVITLDALTQESHEHSSTVSQHPIEDGSFVTDHVFNEPRSVSISGEITDSPVTFFSAINSVKGLLDNETSIKRSVEAYDQLLAIYKSRDVVTLVTGLKVYSDMVLERFNVPRDQQTGKRLQFTADFKEMRKVTSQVVRIAKVSEENEDKASEEKDVGRQETTDATVAQEVKAGSKSLLFKVLGG